MSKVTVIDRTNALVNAARRALPGAVRAGALVIETEAKRLTPARTGTLRRSIGTEVRESPDRASARIGPDASVEYARFVEFGTSRMSARPFMRPAYESRRAEAGQTIKDQMAAGMRGALPATGGR